MTLVIPVVLVTVESERVYFIDIIKIDLINEMTERIDYTYGNNKESRQYYLSRNIYS